MAGLEVVDGERLVSLATGRGGTPTPAEWPLLSVVLLAFAISFGYLLYAFGLTKFEATLVAAAAPLTVLFDLPLGDAAPGVLLAANVAGCIIPFFVSIKIIASGRLPGGTLLALVGVGTLASFLSSEVVPTRGVLLHYRAPAIIVGILAGVLWHRHVKKQKDRKAQEAERGPGSAAGAGAYVAGASGVIIGADLVNLAQLANAGTASRIVIGGAGLLDGIYLVGFLSAGVAAATVVVFRYVNAWRPPLRAPA